MEYKIGEFSNFCLTKKLVRILTLFLQNGQHSILYLRPFSLLPSIKVTFCSINMDDTWMTRTKENNS
jgi:hypothetical protein